MKKFVISLLILFFTITISSAVNAGSFKLHRRYAQPVQDPKSSIGGKILFASWIDDKNIIFGTDGGIVRRIEVATGREKWTIRNTDAIEGWSFCRKLGRLAYRIHERICVVDCSTGKKLFDANQKRIRHLLSRKDADLSCLAISPTDGQLLICCGTYWYGRNGYVLDSSYRKVVSTFYVDAFPKEISLSPNGHDLSVIGYLDVLNVRDISKHCDLFFRGKRMLPAPKQPRKPLPKKAVPNLPVQRAEEDGGSIPTIINSTGGAFNCMRYDGRKTVVCSHTGNCFNKGWISIYDTSQREKKPKNICSHNHQIKIDVDFKTQRVVLTGSSTNLKLVNFNGKTLAHAKKITLQENLCVQFSPSGKQVLVGSADNTLSVFNIIE